MPHHLSMVEYVVGLVLCGGLLAVSWAAISESHQRLENPNDDRTIFLNQLSEKENLTAYGTYQVTIFRQSGYVHASHTVTGGARDALSSVLTTFRKAQIDAIHVRTNTERELTVTRLYHSHRGRSEGKKVGWATIELLAEVATQPSPAKEQRLVVSFDLLCDCGVTKTIQLEEVAWKHECSACGKENAFTPVQVASIRTQADAAIKGIHARIEGGEPFEDVARSIKGKEFALRPPASDDGTMEG
jgi:hypothetical protein